MPARRQLPILTQVHRHGKAAPSGAAASLVRLNALSSDQVPHVNASVARCACQVVLISAQRNRPHIAAISLGRRDLPPQFPAAAVFFAFPDLNFASEANARRDVAESTARGRDVVAAELVCVCDLLLEREGRLACVVEAEGRGAAGGEEAVNCRGEGEDLGRVGWYVLVSRVAESCRRAAPLAGLTCLGPPCGR
jgi:hypothetical protein